MKLGCIVSTYHDKRRRDLDAIAEAWSRQVGEVWIANANPRPWAPKSAPVRAINFGFDPGTAADYALATLMDADVIFFADDDVIPEPGFVDEWAHWLPAVAAGEAIIGVQGRILHGPDYATQTVYCRADTVKTPTRVGIAGVLTATGRAGIGFDCRNVARNTDDLYWAFVGRPEIPRWIVPNTAYRDLPTGGDGTAMYRDPALKQQRQAFFAAHWRPTPNLPASTKSEGCVGPEAGGVPHPT